MCPKLWLKTRLRKSSTDEEVEDSTLEKFYPNFWAQLQITWFFTLTFIKQTMTPPKYSEGSIFNFILTYLFNSFRTQACSEGIGTNGTPRSHARWHPYPNPQPVKVGHTPGSIRSTLFEQWCGFFDVPQEQMNESVVRRDLPFFVLIREDQKV